MQEALAFVAEEGCELEKINILQKRFGLDIGGVTLLEIYWVLQKTFTRVLHIRREAHIVAISI